MKVQYNDKHENVKLPNKKTDRGKNERNTVIANY